MHSLKVPYPQEKFSSKLMVSVLTLKRYLWRKKYIPHYGKLHKNLKKKCLINTFIVLISKPTTHFCHVTGGFQEKCTLILFFVGSIKRFFCYKHKIEKFLLSEWKEVIHQFLDIEELGRRLVKILEI